MKKIFLFAAAAAMILAACSKELGGGGEDLPNTDFQVKLSFTKKAEGRAAGAKAVETAIGIEDGYLCFVSAADVITAVYTISDAPTAGSNIDKDQPDALLQNVPGNSTMAWLIANKNGLAAVPAVNGSMSNYLNNKMSVTGQGEYTTVTCVACAPLTGNGDTRAAAITLSTNVSRIQIENLAFDGDITGNVAGIFISSFYPEMELDGSVGTLAETFNKDHYVGGAEGSIFTTALAKYVYDEFTTPIGATVTPTGGVVWGYNLFTSPTPKIVIKLTEVVANGQNLGIQFITVNGFSKGSTPVTTLAGGMIYTIATGSLVIKPEHLDPEPDMKSISVEVTVKQAEWKETVVTPNL